MRIALLMFCLLLSGCYYGTYKPNMQAIPSIKKKGDWSGSITAQNIQMNYSMVKGWAAIANGYGYKGKLPTIDDGKSWNYTRESRLLELGLCHYAVNRDSNMVYLLGGTGWGFADFSFGESAAPGTGGKRGGYTHFTKYFFQPVVTSRKKKTEFSFSFRMTVVNLKDYVDYSGNNLQYKAPFFLEPALTLKRDHNNFGVLYQVQYSLTPENGVGYRHYAFRTMPTLHFGFYGYLGR